MSKFDRKYESDSEKEWTESDRDYDGSSETDSDENDGNYEPEEEIQALTEDGETGEEEENLAAVAERITGMRHSQVVSAAPIRTRQDDHTGSLLQHTAEITAVESAAVPAAKPASERTGQHSASSRAGAASAKSGAARKPTAKKKKSVLRPRYIIPAVLAVAVLAVLFVTALHSASDETDVPDNSTEITASQLSDPSTLSASEKTDPAGEPSAEETLPDPETTPEEETAPTEKTEEPDPESADPVQAPEAAASDDPEQNPESDPANESAEEPAAEEPAPSVAEPEPVAESEPEPEPEPEFWLQINFYDRDPIGLMTTATTLRQVLADNNIQLTEAEVPSVDLDEWLTGYTAVTVDSYSWDTVTVSEEIPFTSEVTELDTIPKGTVNPIRAGENGQKDIVYTVEYKNGVEIGRSQQSETIVKSPVSEQYELGVGGTLVGLDGNTYSYSYRRTVQATYYNLEGLTYIGTMADESVIAVDMNYIPMGTKVYVKNDRYDFGVRTAADIGGQVDNWEIDIWLSETNPYYPAFSQEDYIYDMEIYYLD